MACVEITPDDFDDMHHALGRPDLATLSEGENYRNYFATEAGSPWAVHAEALGVWDRITRDGAGIVTYRLNADGKSALADWLSLQPRAVAPEPPFPTGSATNCKRAGWAAYFAGRGREDCPFPSGRRDLQTGYREGWDAALALRGASTETEGL